MILLVLRACTLYRSAFLLPPHPAAPCACPAPQCPIWSDIDTEISRYYWILSISVARCAQYDINFGCEIIESNISRYIGCASWCSKILLKHCFWFDFGESTWSYAKDLKGRIWECNTFPFKMNYRKEASKWASKNPYTIHFSAWTPLRNEQKSAL